MNESMLHVKRVLLRIVDKSAVKMTGVTGDSSFLALFQACGLILLLVVGGGLVAQEREAAPADCPEGKTRVEPSAVIVTGEDQIDRLQYQVPVNRPSETLGGEGLQLVFATTASGRGKGSLERLVELARQGDGQVTASVPVYHGMITTPCTTLKVLDDNVVDCALKVWCTDHGKGMIPDDHGHNIHIRSDGTFHHVVVTHHQSGRERIVAMESGEAPVAFYALRP